MSTGSESLPAAPPSSSNPTPMSQIERPSSLTRTGMDPTPTPVIKKRPYVPHNYAYDRVGKIVRAEVRNLLKKYRVIVLPPDCLATFIKLSGTNLPHRALEKIARDSGAEVLSITLASRMPKESYNPWNSYFVNGDETLCIFLEGEGWKIEEQAVDNLLNVFGLTRDSIEERYPWTDEMC